MNTNPETADLREVVQQTVEMVQQNARDNAYLRGAFEQMNHRFDNLVQSIDQRFGQVDKRFDSVDQRFEQVDKRFEQLERRFEAIEARISRVEGQLNTQLRWIIGLMAPHISSPHRSGCQGVPRFVVRLFSFRLITHFV